MYRALVNSSKIINYFFFYSETDYYQNVNADSKSLI